MVDEKQKKLIEAFAEIDKLEDELKQVRPLFPFLSLDSFLKSVILMYFLVRSATMSLRSFMPTLRNSRASAAS